MLAKASKWCQKMLAVKANVVECAVCLECCGCLRTGNAPIGMQLRELGKELCPDGSCLRGGGWHVGQQRADRSVRRCYLPKENGNGRLFTICLASRSFTDTRMLHRGR
jgi:hypothetical protein